MGMSDLLDMYTQSLRAAGPRAEGTTNKACYRAEGMLQLICNTFLASCAQAKSSVELQQLYL